MFKTNIEQKTLKNQQYRKILHTNKFMQVVVMSLNPGQDIPEEKHAGSQFIRVESGKCVVIVNRKRCTLLDGHAIVIPPGSTHYVKAGKEGAKLYTIYSPPEH